MAYGQDIGMFGGYEGIMVGNGAKASLKNALLSLQRKHASIYIQQGDGTADEVQGNAVLSSGAKRVAYIGGDININAQLVIPTGVTVDTYGSTIKPSQDMTSAILVHRGASLPYLHFDSRGLGDGGWTGAGVELDGDDQWYYNCTSNLGNWFFNNYVAGATPTGKGIWIHSDLKDEYVDHVGINNIWGMNFEYLVYYEAEGGDGALGGAEVAHTNGNVISNVRANNCIYVVGYEAKTGGVWVGATDSNQILGGRVQVTNYTQAIVRHVALGHTNYVQLRSADTSGMAGSNIVIFSDNCGGNTVELQLDGDIDMIQDGKVSWGTNSFNNTVIQTSDYHRREGKWLQRGVKRYWHKITENYDSTLFDAAGLTDSKTIWSQPANSRVLEAHQEKTSYFGATSMTDLRTITGTAGDDNGFITNSANLTTATYYTTEVTKGALFDAGGSYYSAAGIDWVVKVTATGANLDTLTRGKLTFWILVEVYGV